MSSPPHSPLSPLAEHEAERKESTTRADPLTLGVPRIGQSQSMHSAGNTTVHTGQPTGSDGMQSMLLALVAEMRADREERKTETAQLKGQVQQLQQALLQLDGMAPPARSSLPSTAYQMLTTPPPVSETFGTGLRSAAAASAPQEGGVRRSLSSQLGAVGVKRSEPTVWEQITPGPTRDREEETGMRSTLRVKDMHKGVKGPEVFSGEDSKQRTSVRTWVMRMNNWMDLYLGEEDNEQEERMRTVGTRLDGSALIWYQALRQQAKKEGKTLRWNEVIPLFIQKHEGQDNHLLQQLEFNNLTYRRGRCGDLYKLEAEFDRLRLLLHPESEINAAVDKLMGEQYGQAIARGDSALYMKVLELGIPQSLNQWKMTAQRALVLRQTSQALTNSASRGGYQRSSQSSSQQHQIRANRVQAEDGEFGEGEETGQRREEQPEMGVAAQAALAQLPRRNKHLKYEPMQTLKKMGACFLCYQKGHMVSSCPCPTNKLPQRAPTAEELKA